MRVSGGCLCVFLQAGCVCRWWIPDTHIFTPVTIPDLYVCIWTLTWKISQESTREKTGRSFRNFTPDLKIHSESDEYGVGGVRLIHFCSSWCACLIIYHEGGSAIPFPRWPSSWIFSTHDIIVLNCCWAWCEINRATAPRSEPTTQPSYRFEVALPSGTEQMIMIRENSRGTDKWSTTARRLRDNKSGFTHWADADWRVCLLSPMNPGRAVLPVIPSSFPPWLNSEKRAEDFHFQRLKVKKWSISLVDL